MQVCMNEAADLAALVTKLWEDHAKELEAQNLKHASKLSKMTEQKKNLSANLETVMKNSQEQHEKMSRALKTVEDKLASHADELTTIHDNVLCNFPLYVIPDFLGLSHLFFDFHFFCQRSPSQLG